MHYVVIILLIVTALIIFNFLKKSSDKRAEKEEYIKEGHITHSLLNSGKSGFDFHKKNIHIEDDSIPFNKRQQFIETKYMNLLNVDPDPVLISPSDSDKKDKVEKSKSNSNGHSKDSSDMDKAQGSGNQIESKPNVKDDLRPDNHNMFVDSHTGEIVPIDQINQIDNDQLIKQSKSEDTEVQNQLTDNKDLEKAEAKIQKSKSDVQSNEDISVKESESESEPTKSHPEKDIKHIKREDLREKKLNRKSKASTIDHSIQKIAYKKPSKKTIDTVNKICNQFDQDITDFFKNRINQ